MSIIIKHFPILREVVWHLDLRDKAAGASSPILALPCNNWVTLVT